ncbi:aminotransferase-like domain-containing protein [Konateibacter massiliensis]|uniref:aminotransferase-like domain-containing protein n=1 Tax=Konateibacter massiliensis TaxID=2002841 RepID=UPI000C15B681|nr:PLP-dependent aminotransferase family protein [Konateibacter massiliensis]
MPVNSFENYPLSWKPDKSRLKAPYYLSLAKALENDIARGLLAPGTKLPPQRELADYLDLNFTTITRVYKQCGQKGLVYGITGKGTFVSPNALRSVTISAGNFSGDCIDLGIVASFEECNAMLLECTANILEQSQVASLFDYNNPTGIPYQKMAGLNWMSSFGIEADIDHVAIVSGTQNALAIALLGLFSPGDQIAVDTFIFANFIELSRIYHIQLIPIEGDENGMIPEELENACKQNKIQGVFLMPCCSNPTTIMMSDKRKRALAKIIEKYRLLVIEDDIHAFMTAGIMPDYRQSFFSILPEQTVYLCGTSKSICSGLRVAYLVFGERLKEGILSAIFNVNVKTSSLDAEVITQAILTGTAHKIVAKKRQLAERRNALFDEYFDNKVPNGHPYSYYRWLPISNEKNGGVIEAELMERGIRVYHSDRFLSGKYSDDAFLRISLATVDDENRLRSGLEILKGYLDEN